MKNRVAFWGEPAIPLGGVVGSRATIAETGMRVAGSPASRVVPGARKNTLTRSGFASAVVLNEDVSMSRSKVTVKPLMRRVPSAVNVWLYPPGAAAVTAP